MPAENLVPSLYSGRKEEQMEKRTTKKSLWANFYLFSAGVPNLSQSKSKENKIYSVKMLQAFKKHLN